jgi:hypothetical protein
MLAASIAPVSLACSRDSYAVLVGVNVYTQLDAENQLEGPAHDVALMRIVLRSRGFPDDHIVMLADGLEGARTPTREGILQALAEVTNRARRGDFVYLHFSGHGSQQPEDPARTDRGHKPDGMNEIFLPRDTGRWSDSAVTVTNAILDYEMNRVITALRNKGAFVWAVFDSCHSASMARGAALARVHFRRVDPLTLGVPAAALQRAAQMAAASGSLSAAPGTVNARGAATGGGRLGPADQLAADAAGFVAFYAAQTFETAPEEPLPRQAADPAEQGLFSFTLAQGVAQNGSLTYRQLRDYILQKYAALGEWSVTPLMEGTALDAPIFGDTDAKRIEQWPILNTHAQLKIPAGALNNLSDGALFAVLANPTAKDDEALGYLRADRVSVFETELSMTDEHPAGSDSIPLPADALPKSAYARLMQTRPNFLLNVALPPNSFPEGSDQARARALLRTWRSAPPQALRVNWVEAGDPADLRLSFGEIGVQTARRKDELWLLPPTGDLVAAGPEKTPSLNLHQSAADLASKLEDSLRRISRAVNLLRIAAALPAGGGSEADTEIRVLLTRAHGSETQPLPDGALPKLFSDDVLEFTLHNRGPKPADVTLLFLDSQYGITAMYPEAGRLNRIAPDGSDHVKIQIDADTLGVERMLAIVVTVEPNQPNADFSFLQQDTLPKTRGSTSPLQQLFETAAFGGSTTRGLTRMIDTNHARMRLFSWQTALPLVATSTGR